MTNVLVIAKKMNDLYKQDHKEKNMDNLRINKLLYLLQRESMIRNNFAPLFEEAFEAWKMGPVMPCVYREMKKSQPFSGVYGKLSRKEQSLINIVYKMYERKTSWELNLMTLQEFSWRYAAEKGMTEITLNSMKVDAMKEQMIRKEQEMMQ